MFTVLAVLYIITLIIYYSKVVITFDISLSACVSCLYVLFAVRGYIYIYAIFDLLFTPV